MISTLATRPPAAIQTDADLVNRYVRDRDAETFRELARRLGPVALAAARTMTRDEQEAEDAAQVTLAELARKAGTIEDPACAAGWVRTAAVRATLKLKRARRRWRPLPQEPVDAASQLSEVRGFADAETLHEELGELPASWREPLLLRYFGGLDNEEAAARLGCSVAAVEGRLKRAKRTLRERLLRRGVGVAVALSILERSAARPASAADWSEAADAALELSQDGVDLPTPAADAAPAAPSAFGKLAVAAAVGVAALLSLSGGDAPRSSAPVISTVAAADPPEAVSAPVATAEGGETPAETAVQVPAEEAGEEVVETAGDGSEKTKVAYEIEPWMTPLIYDYMEHWKGQDPDAPTLAFANDGGSVSLVGKKAGEAHNFVVGEPNRNAFDYTVPSHGFGRPTFAVTSLDQLISSMREGEASERRYKEEATQIRQRIEELGKDTPGGLVAQYQLERAWEALQKDRAYHLRQLSQSKWEAFQETLKQRAKYSSSNKAATQATRRD